MATRMPAAAHIQVDSFRKMVKGGYCSPHHWDEEVDRQYKIARRAAADTAVRFAVAGFLPILDDVIAPGWEEEWKIYFLGMQLDIVLLRPTLEVALERNLTREIWTVEDRVMRDLYDMLGQDYTSGWYLYDNSEGTASDAAEAILTELKLR